MQATVQNLRWRLLLHPFRSVKQWSIDETRYLPNVEALRRARLTLVFLTVLLFWCVFFAIYYTAVIHNAASVLIVLAGGLLGLMIPFVLKWTASAFIAGNFLTGIVLIVIGGLQITNILPGRPLPVWLAALPMIGMSLAGRRSGYFWAVCSLAGFIGSYLVDVTFFPFGDNPTVGMMKKFQLVLLCTLTILVTSLTMLYEIVTERIVANLYATQHKLLQADKMAVLGEMAAGIAHEINNPLAIIQTSAAQAQELLAEGLSDRSLLEGRLIVVQETVSRIAKIISGLRDFSRDGSQDQRHPEELRTILENVASLCAEKFRSENIAFSVECAYPTTRIACRKVEISQILLNLLNNARDAVKASQDKWIKLSCQTDGKIIDIIVQDSGPGIPEVIQDRIFIPFFTSKDVGQGTGLGLSICRTFATANGGELFLKTNAPNTSFVLRFPAIV